MLFEAAFTSSNYGNLNDRYLDHLNYSYAGGYGDHGFVKSVQIDYCSTRMVIWLLGGCSYRYLNINDCEIESIPTFDENGKYISFNGLTELKDGDDDTQNPKGWNLKSYPMPKKVSKYRLAMETNFLDIKKNNISVPSEDEFDFGVTF